MICDCCRRDVDYAGDSFWHRDARICRECFAQWCNPDQIESTDYASIGNCVRFRHGLPPIVAALAVMALGLATTAQASRHCLDQVQAARTWPARALATVAGPTTITSRASRKQRSRRRRRARRRPRMSAGRRPTWSTSSCPSLSLCRRKGRHWASVIWRCSYRSCLRSPP